MAKQFTDDNFDAEVLQSDKLTVVDFWATWCGPCRLLAPTIEALADEYKDANVQIGKVDVDSNPGIAMKYGVRNIPTVLFIKGGEVIDKTVGNQPKFKLAKLIDQHATA